VKLSILLFLVLIPAVAADKSHAPLIGSWKLTSYTDKDADGISVFPFGKAPAGLLIYDGTGHMSVQIMKTPPPDVAIDDWDRFTVQEKVALFDGYSAYFGRYEIDDRRHVVTHLPVADLSRIYIGRREKRHYQITGDRLMLSETWTQSGKRWTGVRTWERVK
jgi:hypothetical protein